MENAALYEIHNSHTALITLNRPQRRNAISQDLLFHLYNHLETAAKDPAVRCAIITGAGKSFCSGLDLDRLLSDNLMDPRGDGKDLSDILSGFDKPLIGAVNGHAITGGLEIALNCDFLIASENAAFADTHVKVGIHPGWGMSQLLKEAAGVRMARRMSFTGEFIDAATALRCGLVCEVVPQERLLPRALEIAGKTAAVNQDMLKTVRGLIKKGALLTVGEGMEMERGGFRTFLKNAGMLKTS
jgi:enoyl-CoA hydratase